MKKVVTTTILVISALAVVFGLGFGAVKAVSAASYTRGNPPGMMMEQGGRGFGGGTNEELATALGITVDELTAAQDTARTAALEQAVKDGLITQAQADEITGNGRGIPFGGMWGGWLGKNGVEFDQYLADALGITVDELEAAQTKAFESRLTQAVEDGQITQEQADLMIARHLLQSNENFKSSMQSAYQAAVQQAVKDGVISQSQADLLLENTNEWGGCPFGGGRRHGGW